MTRRIIVSDLSKMPAEKKTRTDIIERLDLSCSKMKGMVISADV